MTTEESDPKTRKDDDQDSDGGNESDAETTGSKPGKGQGMQVKAPHMGGVIETKPNEWVVWTGGKPKPDWSGLKNPNVTRQALTMQLGRLRSLTGGSKEETSRRKGIEPKFTAGGNLRKFLLKVDAHLEHKGLDTIAYILDPAKVEMRSVVQAYPRFTCELVHEQLKEQVTC